MSRSSKRAAIALAAALALLIPLAAGSGAAGKATTTVVLGGTATMPDPSCPELPCQAVGSVTGFQVSTTQSSLPFRVNRPGRVKSWTLTLAQPTNQQRSFFNGFFGTPPEARLAILRRVPGTNPPRYNLRSQGSVHVLTPYLGQTVRFSASLKVETGDVVGLTIPTWAPAFAQDLTAQDSWRASREPGKCTNTTDVRQGQPQETIGRRATYGCLYSTARLLYTATVVEE
ncbi:MAG TPA: hypothetical protein VHQ43_00245 [Solirubrobacterales bacterium]|jgi:hypothetical protein|nr:hypothetical protein [Solirubrobacterales bacterium]